MAVGRGPGLSPLPAELRRSSRINPACLAADADGLALGQPRQMKKRDFAPDQLDALGKAQAILGNKTFDIHLGEGGSWQNVPKAVWDGRAGGCLVLRKWLAGLRP